MHIASQLAQAHHSLKREACGIGLYVIRLHRSSGTHELANARFERKARGVRVRSCSRTAFVTACLVRASTQNVRSFHLEVPSKSSV